MATALGIKTNKTSGEMVDSMEFETEKEFPEPQSTFSHALLRTQSYDAAGADLEGEDLHFSPINPLHASFDASQLEQPSASALPRFRPTASWEENDPSVAAEAKHAHFSMAYGDTGTQQAPPTGRKLPRHSSDAVGLMSKTPLRSRLRSKRTSTAKRTPASARRHRAPLHQRRSPRVLHMTPQRQHHLFPTSIVKTTTPQGSVIGEQFAAASHPRQMPSLLFDEETEETPFTLAAQRQKKQSIGTVTTAASSAVLETTTDTEDSMDTNDAPFRFTSFPASLPRVNSLRTSALGASGPSIPGTVRKRMYFDAPLETSNRSRDDATHNTSVSSLPVDDGHLHAESLDEAPEDAPRSPIGTPVARTRLDFASVLSPNMGTQRGNTPLRQGAPDEPTTPREVKMHFLNAGNCSPIRGIPEEECEGSSGKSVGGFSRHTRTSSRSSSESGHTSRPGIVRPMPDMNAFDAGGSTTSSRETRPMPDMHAFEENSSTFFRERSGDETVSTKSHPSSPKLLCPPTPVRTPAWAHGDSSGSISLQRVGKMGRFNRQNSLIATKILATCSTHVLNERNSLENSVLDDDGSGNHDKNTSSLSASSTSVDRALSFDVETVVANDTMDDSSDWSHDGEKKGRPSESSEHTVSMSTSFEILSMLGSGTFADVYKVRSKIDGRMYAVKKNRRQFRGKRDREQALAEVRHMQRLQSAVSATEGRSSYSLYLLFFFQAWQEDGHFFCQTELCCRDTCRELLDVLRSDWRVAHTRYPSLRTLPCPQGVVAGSEADNFGRLTPEASIWKICHDISAGLSQIHSHGLVHHDIKPSNIFFVSHSRFGAMCKIGDFGMAGEIGSSEDGQEGDQKYMAPELLTTATKHPSADIFSLGLTLYELASYCDFEVPPDGTRWHELREGTPRLELPTSRSPELVPLIRAMMHPDHGKRPSADAIVTAPAVASAGHHCDEFLRDYIHDIEEYDRREEQRVGVGNQEQTPIVPSRLRVWASPSYGTLPVAPILTAPDAV